MTNREVSQAKNLEIKLFGKTICLPESCALATTGELPDVGRQTSGKSQRVDVCSQPSEKTEGELMKVHMEENGNPEKSSVALNCNKGNEKHTNNEEAQEQCELKEDNEMPETPSVSLDDHEEGQQHTNSNEVQGKPEPKENQSEIDDIDQDKDFKRPDKVIPCPRCHSLETKFCYFNNYNVNQPRHYCKNCQRYWTAGGSMRNVPVGAGRRKNKQLATPCHPLLKPAGGLQSTKDVIPDMANQLILSSGKSVNAFSSPPGQGTILKFGCGGLVLDSMSSAPSPRDQIQPHLSPSPETGEKSSSLGNSSLTNSCVRENKTTEISMRQKKGGLSHFWNKCTSHCPQYYRVSDRLSPSNPGWDSSACLAGSQVSKLSYNPCGNKSNMISGCSSSTSAIPSHLSTSFPQFMPTPPQDPLPGWAISSGNMFGSGTNRGPLPFVCTSNTSTVNKFQSLGKHCREENSMEEEKLEKCIVIPKTLRINALNEVSGSSTSESFAQ